MAGRPCAHLCCSPTLESRPGVQTLPGLGLPSHPHPLHGTGATFLLGNGLGLRPRRPRTSSSLKAIMETAWKTAAVDPVMVVMRSGQEPSEMVIRALLCGHRTGDGQRGSSAPSPATRPPAPFAGPSKAGNHRPWGAFAGPPRRWGSRRRWARDRPSPPHTPPSPAPGSA